MAIDGSLKKLIGKEITSQKVPVLYGIKKLANNIYFLALEDSKTCYQYGVLLNNHHKKQPFPANSLLILDASLSTADHIWTDEFSKGVNNFKAIAYITGNKVKEQTPWAHTAQVSGMVDTYYFRNLENAFNWSKSKLATM